MNTAQQLPAPFLERFAAEQFTEAFVYARKKLIRARAGFDWLVSANKQLGARLIGIQDLGFVIPGGRIPTNDREYWMRQMAGGGRSLAKLIDAEALAWCERAGVYVAQGLRRQLLFQTRDHQLQGIIRGQQGSFSCALSSYLDPHETKRPISIVRDWRYAYELGVLWTDNPVDARFQAGKRREAFRAALRHATTDPEAVRNTLAEETGRELANKRAVLATVHPWIPESKQKGDTKSQVLEAVRQIILIIADPARFNQVRERYRKQLVDRLAILDQSLDALFGAPNPAFNARHYGLPFYSFLGALRLEDLYSSL